MSERIITKQAVRQVLSDYWQQYKAHPVETLVGFLLPAIGSILVFFVPPLILAKIIDIFSTQHKISYSSVQGYIILFGVLWLLGEICWRIGMQYLTKLRSEGMNDLAKIAFRRLSGRDYAFYTNNFVGSLTKKTSTFSSGFDNFTNILSFNIVTNIFPIFFAVFILWRYSFWIPLILISFLVITVIVALPIIHRRSKFVIARHHASSKMAGRLSDITTNMITIKSFAQEDQEYDQYGAYINDYSQKYKRAADYENLYLNAVLSPIYVVTNLAGLIAAIFFAGKFGLQTGAIIVVFSYYSQVTRIFWEINNVYRGIESNVTEAAEFTQLFVDPPAVMDIPHARELSIENASIGFNQVNFNYDNKEGSESSFLNKFDLYIKSREKVGLVGPSGGGKTTITKLLLRFIDLQSGNITIDNQDISLVTQASLRENIAYVPQEPLLFHRSLLENIAYSNQNATKEDVIRAAELAHADEFINQLPHGYETLVGERGIKLSGGQRQRIAIARAILKNSPILVLDEATSSLDSESEKYIQEGLLELMKDKTALVIAHRLSTIKHLDRIIVLDGGKIVEDGTHDQLLKEKGLYAKLWSHQSGEFL